MGTFQFLVLGRFYWHYVYIFNLILEELEGNNKVL